MIIVVIISVNVFQQFLHLRLREANCEEKKTIDFAKFKSRTEIRVQMGRERVEVLKILCSKLTSKHRQTILSSCVLEIKETLTSLEGICCVLPTALCYKFSGLDVTSTIIEETLKGNGIPVHPINLAKIRESFRHVLAKICKRGNDGTVAISGKFKFLAHEIKRCRQKSISSAERKETKKIPPQ